MLEIWKSIDNTNGEYEISSIGNIRKVSPTGYASICPSKDRCGYLRIFLKSLNKSIAVHRLVAMAFIPNPHNFPVVHHIDENKSNNAVTNLQWCTYAQNRIFASNSENKRGGRKTVIQTDLDGKIVGKYRTFCEAARAIGIKDSSTIRACALGKNNLKTAYGYKWEIYFDEPRANHYPAFKNDFFKLANQAYELAPDLTTELLQTIISTAQGHL